MKEFIREVYFPRKAKTPFSFENFIGGKPYALYSFGRIALKEAFVAYGLKAGDRVLFPAFICRDLLSAAAALDLKILFYPVNEKLEMGVAPDTLPEAQAILAVDYFGYPQNMEPFFQYQSIHRCLLIEDNAHSFLSKDSNGRILGLRGDVGIFSLRKMIPSYLGGALVFVKLPSSSRKQLEFVSGGYSKVKELARELGRVTHAVWPLNLLMVLQRKLRKLRTGHEIPPSPPDAEKVLPANPQPTEFLKTTLAALDPEAEITKRRELYAYVETYLAKFGVKPYLSNWPSSSVPYGFVFRAAKGELPKIQEALSKIELECFNWPDLPDQVAHQSHPAFYDELNVVRFLW